MTIIAPDNLPATMPAGASAFYARNISALLLGMVKDGALNLDFEDEVTKATVITHGGAVVSEAVKKLLEPAAAGRWRPRVSTELLTSLAIFVLAILVGFEVISKVPATLHTPLMSGANSIHGIVLVGAMLIAAEADNPVSYLLAFVADGVRRDERRRRLRRHRPDAPDVPQEAGGPEGPPRRDAAARRLARSTLDVDSGSTPSSTSPGWRGPPASCSASTG